MKTTRKKPGPRPRRLRRLPRLWAGPSLEQRVSFTHLEDYVRAYRVEGRALTGFEAAEIRSAAGLYGKDEIIALAWASACACRRPLRKRRFFERFTTRS